MPAESKLPAFVPHKTIPACFAYHMAATICIQCICVLYFRCRLYPNIVNNTIIAHLRSNILSCHNVVRQARWNRGSAAASDGIFPSLLLNVNQKHIYYILYIYASRHWRRQMLLIYTNLIALTTNTPYSGTFASGCNIFNLQLCACVFVVVIWSSIVMQLNSTTDPAAV